MESSYHEFFNDFYEKYARTWKVEQRNGDSLEVWQEKVRNVLRQCSGLEKIEAYAKKFHTPEPVKVEETIQEVGYTRRKIYLNTLPGVWMPVHVLIPDGVDEKHPAKTMIAIPSHGSNKDVVAGVESDEYVKEALARAPKVSYGKTFVKMGYVVFCPDPSGYGERQEMRMDQKKNGIKKSSLESSCSVLELTSGAMGLSLLGLITFDLQNLFTYLSAQKYVQPEHIGCVGFSGGGLYTMWLAAMEPRLRLAVISSYVHGYQSTMLESHLCACNYIPNLWNVVDICDILALIAPRPLYIENGIQDGSNGPEGILRVEEQVERVRSVYENQENLVFREFEGGHQWYEGCLDFVREKL